jgi:hypothetical protein
VAAAALPACGVVFHSYGFERDRHPMRVRPMGSAVFAAGQPRIAVLDQMRRVEERRARTRGSTPSAYLIRESRSLTRSRVERVSGGAARALSSALNWESRTNQNKFRVRAARRWMLL